MKTGTIEKVLKKKLTEWLETITDETLRRDVKDGLLVSGGSIASMLLGEKVNDFDIYLSNMDLVKRVAEYYLQPFDKDCVFVIDGREKEKHLKEIERKYADGIEHDNSFVVPIRTLKENQIKIFVVGGGGYAVEGEKKPAEKGKYLPLYFSPNAITLSDDIQIVLRFYGSAKEIHETFDFVHATNYFTFKDGLVTNVRALECLLTKTLIYQGSHYPLTSIIRTKKFLKRGFRISAGEYLKMMFQISQLNLQDVDTLEEQLIGVDVAYFATLIQILRSKYSSDENFYLTTEYLNTLIDRVFNSAGDEEDNNEYA